MPQETWVLGSDAHVGLAQRGSSVVDPTPIAAMNGASAGNYALEMRQGMEKDDLTGSGFTGPVMWISRFITNQGVEEIWAAANNGGTAALARKVNNAWSPVAFADTPVVTDLLFMNAVGMNGKFFLAYNSNVNRLHVWDGTSVRRVGLGSATAPTLSPGGGASVTRSYRVRYVTLQGAVITRRSEPSASVSATSTLPVTVARGALLNEGETHWEVEVADTAAGPWYHFITVPVAAVSVTDPNATISKTTLSKELGSYDPPPSAKYLATDGLSLMMGGAWEATSQPGETIPKQNRTWFTPPLGTTDIGDDERISNTFNVHGWHDVGDEGPITALLGPVYGETFVMKKSTVAKLTPTGNVDAPYALTVISNAMGCVDQRLAVMGEVGGVPAMLFADSNAVYALTGQGGIASVSEAIGVDLRGLTIIADPGLLIYDPSQRTLLLQTSHAPPSIKGSYRSFMFDCYKKRWEGFVLGGSAGGWVLGVSRLGIDNVLGGGGMQIHNGAYAEQNGERRMYLCGKDAAGGPTISSRGGQAVLDIDQPFTSTVRYRRLFKPGFKTTVGCPTVYYQNPMGTVQGVLTLTATYVKDFIEERSQSVELPPTTFNSRLDVGVYTFEGISSADVSVLDLVLELRYVGQPYQSPVTPAVAAVVVPYLTGEAMAQ